MTAPLPAAPRLTDRKRDAIIQAAIAEFRENGFNGTSMDRVAAVADVSKRTVYNHFPSKEELFEAILMRMWERSQAPDELAYTPDRPLRDQLLELLTQKMRLLNDASFIDLSRAAMADLMHSPERARAITAKLTAKEEGLSRWLRAAQQNGCLRPAMEVPYAAQQLQGMGRGEPRIDHHKAGAEQKQAENLSEHGNSHGHAVALSHRENVGGPQVVRVGVRARRFFNGGGADHPECWLVHGKGGFALGVGGGRHLVGVLFLAEAVVGQAHGRARQGFAAQKHLYVHDAAGLDGGGIVQQDDFQHLVLRGFVQRVIGGRVEQAFGELFILAHRADFLALRFKLRAVALKHALRGFAPYLGQAVPHQQGRGRVRQRNVAHKGDK